MNRLNFVCGVLLCLAFVACGKSEDETKKEESYTYTYESNSCKTGEHKFDSKDAYCKALKNEDLNHGCAQEIRDQAYKQNCA